MNIIRRAFAATALFAIGASQAGAAVIFSEGFDDVGGLVAAGWVISNLSTPGGTTEWFQGNSGVFAAHAGPEDSYLAANFLAAPPGGDIDLYIYSPVLSLQPGDTISFWTRTDAGGADFGDSLYLGLLDGSDGALLGINIGNGIGGFPSEWTQYSAVLEGFGGPALLRFGFLYTGPADILNYIGIDSVEVVRPGPVPEPGSLLLLGLGLAGLGYARRRQG